MDAIQTDVYVPSKQMLEDYDNMDFYDDFEGFCEYYRLPFARLGYDEGGVQLKEFIGRLRERTKRRN